MSLAGEDTECPPQGQEQKFVSFLYFKNCGGFAGRGGVPLISIEAGGICEFQISGSSIRRLYLKRGMDFLVCLQPCEGHSKCLPAGVLGRTACSHAYQFTLYLLEGWSPGPGLAFATLL